MQIEQSKSVARANQHDLPRWVWIGLVFVPVVIMGGAAIVDMEIYRWLHLKEGPLEWATAGVLPIGIVAALLAFRRRAVFPVRWLGTWMILCALGLFYFMGEELSWGQHIFKWEAPEVMKEINRQEETNLHNINTFLGRKPKQIIELWTIIGCIIAPIVLARRSPRFDPRTSAAPWFWPTIVCMPAAILGQVVYSITRIAKAVTEDEPWYLRLSELQELYFALALVLYTCSIALRAGALDRAVAAPPTNGKAASDAEP